MALQSLSRASESSQFVDFSSTLTSMEKPQSDVALKLLILPVYRRLTFSYVNLQFDVIEKSSFNELFFVITKVYFALQGKLNGIAKDSPAERLSD